MLLALFTATALAANFTPGNIVAVQADASASNTTATVVEINAAAASVSAAVQSIAIPGTGTNGMRFSGSATSTMYVATTNDGTLLTFTGANSANTSANVNTLNPRALVALDPTGAVSLATTYTGTSGNQTRGASSLNNTTWYIGDQGGFYTNGTTAASPTGNIRSVKCFGGTVYACTASATLSAVGTIAAPTGSTYTALPGLGAGATSRQDFYLISSGSNGTTYDVLYVLDATSNTVGTIFKYSLVAGSWVANGTYTTTFGGFGLAAAKNGSGAFVYVSTGQGAATANSVIKLTDTAGYNSTIAISTASNVILYTAASGAIIKGVAFAPALVAPDLVVSASAPASAPVNTNFNYTLTASNTGVVDATGVAVNFTLPAGLNFVSAVGDSGFTGVNSAGVVNFTGGSIGVGATATLTVTVTTATGGAYTASVGAAVIDPANAITERNETNNSSTVAATTNVLAAPAITTEPTPSQTIASGATASLMVAASGVPAPTYQWYQGVSGDTSNPVSGAISANFTTPALSVTTSYWARATNASGTADSNTAVVNVSSANANLSSLALSVGALNPGFDSTITSYTATVPNAAANIMVTPTTADTMATVTVQNAAVISGHASAPIDLNVGLNTLSVVVLAPDGITSKTYTVTVRRQSNNADLGSLALSTGTLNPGFARAITGYTASVPNATASLTVTPTVADSAATVTVNTAGVTSGSPSAPISLSVGPNTINVLVTAEDLSTKNYQIVVTRAASNNADLSALTLSTGAFSPAFASARLTYVQIVPNATASFTVHATVADPGASLTVNGVAATSGSVSDPVNLVEGINAIPVLVTAADTTTTKTYTLTIIRQSNAVLGPGAIAFTGFNADGIDNLAFVTLQDIPAHTVIFFTDDEWNGTDWTDAGESAFAWTTTSDVTAGTIIEIDGVSNVYSNTTTVNLGAITPISDATDNAGLSNGADAVYAFQGTGALNANGSEVPTSFLALIANDDPVAGAFSIDGTGLTEAAGTAIIFTESDDGVRYKGARNGLLHFADYLPLFADRADNWDSVGGGDGTTYVPFDPTPFTAGPTVLVTIDDVSVTEGDSGTTAMTFTVTRGSNTGAFTLHYATADGAGTDAATVVDNDYVADSGTITFTAGGALTQPVTVLVNGDTKVEHNERLFVNLSNLVNTSGNAVISDVQGIGTILTDDVVAPTISTEPASQNVSTGAAVTLAVAADGFPVPTYQWYQGTSGDVSNPVPSAMAANFTTPLLFASANYWVRVSNSQGHADSDTAVLTVAFAAPLTSGNGSVLVPNQASWNPAGVNVGGTQFVNLGLQGVGRFPASAIDPATGESIGSVSDMQITGWHKNLDGTYAGTLNTLPDRGFNSGSIFSNYAARINAFNFIFTPYTAAAPTTAQNQIALTFAGSTRFTYDHDGNPATAPVFTTGLLANGSATLFGTEVPVATGPSTESDGTVNNRLTLDSEGLILDSRVGKDGAGWIGDEYGAYIYHFNGNKEIDGLLTLPAALLPHATSGGPISFIDTPANVDGRRVNQGMEGIAQSPDGTKLFGLMQSATMQDSGTSAQARFNTRLVVYDVSGSDTPNVPIAQYVIQLPVIDDTASTTNGSSVDKTAAQSSIVALNDHQLLILSRDGNGRGVPGSPTPVFKSILLADLSTGTNINGAFDNAGDAVAPNGVLTPTVTPISWTEALNMIGKLNATTAEVAKFNLNLSGGNGDTNTICEKWESLGMVSANDPANPNDYFLFIGNDNDFLTGTGKYLDANGVIQSYDAGLENDTLVLAFRVRFSGPEVLVQQPVGTDVAKGSGVAFGPVAPNTSAAKTFTVKNNGTSPLAINSIGVAGGDAANFTVNLAGTSLSLAPGASTTFSVAFRAPGVGTSTTTLAIVNNDFANAGYSVTLTGVVATNPDPVVYDGPTTGAPVIADGQVTPVDFGSVSVSAGVTRTFTVQNAGIGNLTGLSTAIDGANAPDFVVTANPASSLTPGQTTTFSVTFTPSAASTRVAVLHLLSNAPGAKASYDIPLTGTSVLAPANDDAVSSTAGPSVVYPLANDRNLPANAIITSVTGNGVTISADGRSIKIPGGFTGTITYETSAGTTGHILVTATPPVVNALRFTGLLRDSNGAIAGWSNASANAKGTGSAQFIVGTTRGKAKFGFPPTVTQQTVTTTLGDAVFTRNTDGTMGLSLATTGGTLTGTLRPVVRTTTRTTYHIALASVDAAIPGGGFLTLTVKPTGDVTIGGTLPDGRPITAAAALGDNGTISVYSIVTKFAVPPAIVAGELVSANLATTDLTGELAWLKPVQGAGAKGLYLNGIDTLLTANGCVYAGAIPMNGAGTLHLSGGNLVAPQTSHVTVTAGLPPVPTVLLKGWGGVKLTVGTFRVKVQVPGITRAVDGSGVYLPKSNSAWGYFPGRTAGGRVELTVP